MIKSLSIYTICTLLILSCSTQKKFTEITEEDKDELGERVGVFYFDPQKTELYVRTVVKVQATKQVVKYQKIKPRERVYYYLANLEPDMVVDGEKIKIIEEQYLLIDREKNRVLVINNIPNYTEKLFSKDPNKLALVKNGTANKGAPENFLGYDVWKFNQFRFGEIVQENNTTKFIFSDVLHWSADHVWYITAGPDEITLKRFAEKDKYSESIREVRPTYPFEMKFVKIPDYKFILKDNRKGFKRAAAQSSITGNTMHLYRHEKKWHLVFQLTQPPLGMNPFISFNNGTIYAAPLYKTNE